MAGTHRGRTWLQGALPILLAGVHIAGDSQKMMVVGVLLEPYGNCERRAKTEYRNKDLGADFSLKSHRLKHTGTCLGLAYKSA